MLAEKGKRGKKRLLLLIEDNPLLSGLYQNAFEKAGFEVEIAHDGKIGLTLANQKNPDAIILDLLMPGMSGYDVLESLRKDPATKEIKVIVLTVINEKEAWEKTKNLNVSDYLIKTDLRIPEIVERVVSQLK